MDNYRGIYVENKINDVPKFFEGGAHFKYSELYKILESIYKERNKVNSEEKEYNKNLNLNSQIINQSRNIKPLIQSLTHKNSENKKHNNTRNKINYNNYMNYSNNGNNNNNSNAYFDNTNYHDFNTQYRSDYHSNKIVNINNKIYKLTNQKIYHNNSNSIGHNFYSNLNLNEMNLRESLKSNNYYINRNNSNNASLIKPGIISPIEINNSNNNKGNHNSIQSGEIDSNINVTKDPKILFIKDNFSKQFINIQNKINQLKYKSLSKNKREYNIIDNNSIIKNKEFKPMFYNNNNYYINNINSNTFYFPKNSNSIHLTNNNLILINYKYNHNQNDLFNNYNDNILLSSNNKINLLNNISKNKNFMNSNRLIRYSNNF